MSTLLWGLRELQLGEVDKRSFHGPMSRRVPLSLGVSSAILPPELRFASRTPIVVAVASAVPTATVAAASPADFLPAVVVECVAAPPFVSAFLLGEPSALAAVAVAAVPDCLGRRNQILPIHYHSLAANR